jgi:hypothetical protein
VHEGHFIADTVSCNGFGRTWNADHEKESDVNIALHMFDDACQEVFDAAYLVTADSDQGATARMLKARFPAKQLVSVVPPGMEPSKAILTHTKLVRRITVENLEDCLFPSFELDRGAVMYRRPAEYDPPAGWLPPSDRRKAASDANLAR